MQRIITVENLVKYYRVKFKGQERIIEALKGISFSVYEGDFFGLLGPNGAGKTTTINILVTRIRPTSGKAFVDGLDVLSDPIEIRKRIGVVQQFQNLDNKLSVRENLVFHGIYYGLTKRQALKRADELLDFFGLTEKASDKLTSLSGGLRQRLLIARALVHIPKILFLDEPTTGLDPHSRILIWNKLKELNNKGVTIILTTHYMYEAESLCNKVAIIDRGNIIAMDTIEKLKSMLPGEVRISVLFSDHLPTLPSEDTIFSHITHQGESTYIFFSKDLTKALLIISKLAVENNLEIIDLKVQGRSLETLFLELTGREITA